MSSTSYDTGCRPRNETEPLLDSNTANDGEIAGPDNIYWRPIVVITLMLLFSSFATILSQAPFLRVLEDIQCRRYYGEHPPKELNLRDGTIPEEFCKIPQVQELLAEILGIQALLTGIVGLLFAIPYVVAADKVGRRPVLILNIFAQLAAVSWMFLVCWAELPLRWVWMSTAFVLFGGGSPVSDVVATMAITDASPQAVRSRLFLYLQSASLISEVIATPMASILMKKSPWSAILISYVFITVTALLTIFLPETLHLAQKRRVPLPAEDDESISQISVNFGKATFTFERMRVTIKSWLQHVTHAVNFIRRSRIVAFSVIACFTADFGRGSLLFVLQYISERYSLTLSQANYLMSIKAFVNLIFFVILLPAIDVFMVTKLHTSPRRKDFSLAKASIVLTAASFVVLAFAPNVWLVVIALILYAAGCGFISFVRSLLSSLLVPDMLGMLYMILSVMDTLSGLLSGPLCAEALKLGVRLHGFWHGMPYLISAVLCIFGSCIMFAVTIEHWVRGNEEESLLGGQGTEALEG